MQAEHGLYMGIFHASCGDHTLRAANPFFRGLEKQFDIATEKRLVLCQHRGGSQQDRGMNVMAAGVHHALL